MGAHAGRHLSNTRLFASRGFSSWWFLLFLVLIWGSVALVVGWSRSARPTAESVSAFLMKSDFLAVEPAGRAGVIDRAASQLNRLPYEERKKLRKSGADRRFFDRLVPEERIRFLKLTLPEGFSQTMIALNKMTPEKRKGIVEGVLAEIRKGTPEQDMKLVDDHAQELISMGLGTFYRDSSAEVKLEFAPVIEELQRRSQSFR